MIKPALQKLFLFTWCANTDCIQSAFLLFLGARKKLTRINVWFLEQSVSTEMQPKGGT